MAYVDAEGALVPCCLVGGEADVTHRAYESVLFDLLPNGPAWSRDDEGLGDIVAAMATEPSRFDRLLDRLLTVELVPSKTDLYLEEWEETYGLPDCPDAVPSTDDLRRVVLSLKVKAQIGHEQTSAWWAEQLEALGVDLLWWEGGLDVMTCIGDCVDPIADGDWPFVSWQAFEYTGPDLAVFECFIEHYKLGGLKQEAYVPWEQVYSDSGSIRGVACLPNSYVVAVGTSALLRRSTSDWTVWTSPTAPGGTGHIYAAAVGGVLGATVITCGEADIGTLVSVDSGATWDATKLTGTADLYGICRGPSDVFVAVGGGGEIWRTTDADAWASVTSPTANALRGVANGDGVMVAVGDSGTVIRSTTDGASWAAVTGGSNPAGTTALKGVDAYGSIVLVVGAGGYIMRSIDGGASFSTITSPTAVDLLGVTGSHHGRWTAVGVGGVLIQSFDDGATWQVMTSPTAVDLYAVAEHWPDGHAVAGGNSATIIRE